MKKALFLLLFSTSSLFSKACDLSYVSIDSIVPSGPNFFIYMDLCIGGGIQGINAGADGPTQTFTFAIYSALPLSVINYLPASITADATGCTMPGSLAGPAFGAVENLLYNNPGCPTSYTCISSTASCGTPHTDCGQFVIQTTALPDSIRLLGIKGSGNPFGGCPTDNDLLLDVVTWLSVDWGNMQVVEIDERTRRISWETYAEENNDYFEVQRWFAGTHHWETIKIIDGAGNSSTTRYYEYLDEVFLLGQEAYYRIKQLDFNGSYEYSKMLSIQPMDKEIPISFIPNPTSGMTRIVGLDINRDEVQLLNSAGILCPVKLMPDGSFDTSELARGVYLVAVKQREVSVVHRLVVE